MAPADPITGGEAVLGKLLDFGIRVYDDTPKDLRELNAADWAKFLHGVSAQILALQAKISAVTTVVT